MSRRRRTRLPDQPMDPLDTVAVLDMNLSESFSVDHGKKRLRAGSASDFNVRKRSRFNVVNEDSLSDTQFSILTEAASILKVPTSVLLELRATPQSRTKYSAKRPGKPSVAMVGYSNHAEPSIEGNSARSKSAVPKERFLPTPHSMTDSYDMSSCGMGLFPRQIADCLASFSCPDPNLVSGNEYHHEKSSYPPMTFSEHSNQFGNQSMFTAESTVSTQVKPYAPIDLLDEYNFDEHNIGFHCDEVFFNAGERLPASYEYFQPASHLPGMTYPANNDAEDEILISTLYESLDSSNSNHTSTTATQLEFSDLICLIDEPGQESLDPEEADPPDTEELCTVRRKPFQNLHDRQQTAVTRKLIACMRCRMQRIRCEPDPLDPTGICLTCKKLIKPKICRLPCLRYKLTEVRLFREGHFAAGHEWSHRWSSNKMVNITSWVSSEIKTIHVTQDYNSTAIPFQVREFLPMHGDMLHRQWADGDAIKSVPIPNYAIVDMASALRAHKEHIVNDGAKYFESAIKNNDKLLWDTYSMALKYSNTAPTHEERKLLQMVLQLWVTVRLCVRSQRICGMETLGMSINIMDSSSPMHGKIPVPPVLAAQAQFIVTQKLQAPLRGKILDLLQQLTLAQKPIYWFCIYLSTFILLHNCSLLTEHDIGYARKHGLKRRHARPDMINDLHNGANILLAHFHYTCKGFSPFTLTWNPEATTSMAKLDVEQTRFIRQTAIHVNFNELRFKQLLDQGSYEYEHYFIAQLYEEDWTPRSTV